MAQAVLFDLKPCFLRGHPHFLHRPINSVPWYEEHGKHFSVNILSISDSVRYGLPAKTCFALLAAKLSARFKILLHLHKLRDVPNSTADDARKHKLWGGTAAMDKHGPRLNTATVVKH